MVVDKCVRVQINNDTATQRHDILLLSDLFVLGIVKFRTRAYSRSSLALRALYTTPATCFILRGERLPFLLAEEAAEEREEDIEGIENLKQKSHVPRSAWFFGVRCMVYGV